MAIEPSRTEGLERRLGLRPTMRHGLILVAALALVLAADAAIARNFRAAGVLDSSFIGVFLGPWILGVLIVALDRGGPVKFWAGTLVAMTFCPLLALYHDATALASWLREGARPSLPFTILVNAMLLGSFAAYWNAMRPRTCPECRRLAMIPLLRSWGQSRRTANVRWCSACGARFWRSPEKQWQPDRRETW